MNNTAEVIEFNPTEVQLYSEFTAQLAKLKDENSKAVFEYATPKGNKEARSHIFSIRKVKAALEQARKDAKAKALEYGRLVDSKAKEISAELEAMIAVHENPLLEIEERERQRVDYHKRMVQHIVDCGNGLIGGAPYPFAVLFRELEEKITVNESFEEFEAEAHRAKDEAMKKLKAAYEEQSKREAEQAELQRLRQEAEDRARKDHEAKIAAEAAAKAKREAEEAAELERTKAAREQEERDRQQREEASRQALALETAKREKAEAEERAAKAEKAAKEKAEREQQAKIEADRLAAEKREADKKHHAKVNNAAMADLVKAGLPEEMAKLAVTAIAKREVSHITISY